MNIDVVKQYIEYIINKDQSGKVLNPNQFNILAERGQLTYFKKTYGLPEDYVPGRALPRIAYESTQALKDSFRNFEEKTTLSLGSSGIASLPSDYVHHSSSRYKYITQDECGDPTEIEVPIVMLDDKEIGDVLSHPTKSPSKRYPNGEIQGSNVQYYPKDLLSVVFTYLRYPAVPKWAYTIVNDQAVYDAGNSVDFEFPDMDHNDIVRIILADIGINLKDPDIYGYAETKIQSGL